MRKWLILLAFLLPVFFTFGQTTVTGKITDAKSGTPLNGVSVKVRSSNMGTVTNAEGVFSIQVGTDGTLEFSSVGYRSRSVKVGASTNLSITLEPNTADLNEVVVTGNRGMP